MYFIISPTKEMKTKQRDIKRSIPTFVQDSRVLMARLTSLSVAEISNGMRVNEKIATLNKYRYENWQADEKGQCAIDTYSGLQFKQLDFDQYNRKKQRYMNDHLRILSGLYGVLRPFDSIYPYRLEMQYKPFALYAFWHDHLQTYFQKKIVVNVASDEYSKAVDVEMYHIQFRIRKQGKLMTQSTQVKMARGKFIHYVIMNQIKTLAQLKLFNEDNYVFDETLSSKRIYVFVKEQ